jgi:hypothetical protein
VLQSRSGRYGELKILKHSGTRTPITALPRHTYSPVEHVILYFQKGRFLNGLIHIEHLTSTSGLNMSQSFISIEDLL